MAPWLTIPSAETIYTTSVVVNISVVFIATHVTWVFIPVQHRAHPSVAICKWRILRNATQAPTAGWAMTPAVTPTVCSRLGQCAGGLLADY